MPSSENKLIQIEQQQQKHYIMSSSMVVEML